jgi:hypothetical protein
VTTAAQYPAIYRLRNGLIVEASAEWDNVSGFKQPGNCANGAPSQP